VGSVAAGEQGGRTLAAQAQGAQAQGAQAQGAQAQGAQAQGAGAQAAGATRVRQALLVGGLGARRELPGQGAGWCGGVWRWCKRRTARHRRA
jgi:hypothetical protein